MSASAKVTCTLCIHRPHSRVPLLAGFLLSGTRASQLRKRTPTLVTVLRVFHARAHSDAGKRFKIEQVSLPCVCQVLIN